MQDTRRSMHTARCVALIMGAIGAAPGFIPGCYAQTAVALPPVTANKLSGLRFEVASVRLAPDISIVMQGMSPGHPPHIGTKIEGSTVDMGSVSLTNLISKAYSVPPDRVSGPGWMALQRFDVLAKLPAGATKEQLPELLQTLLEERFRLAFHKTNKLESAYALVVGPGGQKLEAAIADNPQHVEDEKGGRGGFGGDSGPAATVMRNGPYGTGRISISNGILHAEFYDIGIKGLAELLTSYMKYPIVDMTGLPGTYHVVLDFAQSEILTSAGNTSALAAETGDQDRSTSVPSDPPFATLFAAVKKLGLKLESRKVPMEQFVVDRIEKMPTEN